MRSPLPPLARWYTLIGYGFVKVFKIVTPDGDIEVNALPEVSSGKHCVDFDYWATNDLNLGELQRLQFAEFAWAIQEYHPWTQAVLWSRTCPGSFESCPAQSYRFSDSRLTALGTALVRHGHQLI